MTPEKHREYRKTAAYQMARDAYCEQKRARDAVYRQKHASTIKARKKLWRDANLKKRLADNARRRADRLQRTPKWLDRQDFQAIRAFYEACPEGYHVDHILPLKGKTVSGLHMLENLQYLPAKENLRKGNR